MAYGILKTESIKMKGTYKNSCIDKYYPDCKFDHKDVENYLEKLKLYCTEGGLKAYTYNVIKCEGDIELWCYLINRKIIRSKCGLHEDITEDYLRSEVGRPYGDFYCFDKDGRVKDILEEKEIRKAEEERNASKREKEMEAIQGKRDVEEDRKWKAKWYWRQFVVSILCVVLAFILSILGSWLSLKRYEVRLEKLENIVSGKIVEKTS